MVALHPEGVDRNSVHLRADVATRVALHPEGVDRNNPLDGKGVKNEKSPSTRRAWIEISSALDLYLLVLVALHPEGVDRNNQVARACDYPSDSRPPPGGRG